MGLGGRGAAVACSPRHPSLRQTSGLKDQLMVQSVLACVVLSAGAVVAEGSWCLCVVLRGGMLLASPWETSEFLGFQLPASQSQHQQTCRQSSPGSGWFGWGCGVEVRVWVVWGTADA